MVSAKLQLNLKEMKIGRLNRDQKGMSLLELVIAIALTGLITAAITTTVFQVFAMNTRTANQMAAVSEVQHAGKTVSEDILQAQTVTPGETLGFPLTLSWDHWVTSTTTDGVEVVYSLVPMPSGDFYRLERAETITPAGGDPNPPTVSIVAEYIDQAQTSCVKVGDAFRFTVTVQVGDEIETRDYEVTPRPSPDT